MKIDNKELTIYYTLQCPYVLNCIKEVTEYCSRNNILLSLKIVDTLEINVVEKPDYETVYNKLITMTLYNNQGGDINRFTLNSDGTGTHYNTYYGYTEVVSTFKWSLDAESMVMTITPDSTDGEYVASMTIIDSENVRVVTDRYGRENTYECTFSDRFTYTE